MKKVFAILAVTVLFAGMASAQLGINVGYAPQTYKTTYTSGSTSTTTSSAMQGFFAGVNYNINLTGDLGVSLGADFRFNTSNKEYIIAGVNLGDAKETQTLIDVPILFNYGLNISDDLKISVFLGPTVSFALSGNTNISNSPLGLYDGDSDWYGDNSDRNRLDIAGTAGVNVQYKAFRLFGGYNMGLLDLDKTSNYKIKASNWFVGLGFSL